MSSPRHFVTSSDIVQCQSPRFTKRIWHDIHVLFYRNWDKYIKLELLHSVFKFSQYSIFIISICMKLVTCNKIFINLSNIWLIFWRSTINDPYRISAVKIGFIHLIWSLPGLALYFEYLNHGGLGYVLLLLVIDSSNHFMVHLKAFIKYFYRKRVLNSNFLLPLCNRRL